MTKRQELIEQGALAEHAFARKAVVRGFQASIQHFSSPFDVLLESRDERVRVQVKSTRQSGPYFSLPIKLGEDNRGYTKNECDVVAVFVKRTNSWYLFPVEECPRALTFTNGRNLSIEPYREAWHYLKSA